MPGAEGDPLMFSLRTNLAISDDTSKEKQGCFTTCFHTFYRHLVGGRLLGMCYMYQVTSTRIHQVQQLKARCEHQRPAG